MSNENAVLENEEKTLVVVEKETPKGVYVHKFATAFEYEGKKFVTLNFDFGSLTGQDMISIEEEMSSQNKYIITPEIDSDFMIRLAAKASGVSSDTLMALPLREFTKIRNKTRDFLINAAY